MVSTPVLLACAVLLFPIWIPLVVFVLCLVACWFVIGQLFESPLFTTVAMTSTLLGLTVSAAGQEYVTTGEAYSFTRITFDCGVLSLLLTTISGTMSGTGFKAKRWAQWLSLASLIGCLGYVIAKGAVSSTSAWTATQMWLVVLSVVFPAFQAATVFRTWRYASPAGAAYFERIILSKTCSTPFTQHTIAGMHTVIFSSNFGKKDTRPIVVFCHGYMSGTAMYFNNLDAFTTHYRVYAVDWLGCGASDRPKFTAQTTAQAEDFCIDALEKWRAELGIESFALVGHSLGGYLCGAYTIRHPSRVSHLVLVSPGGIPTYAAVDPKAATGGMVPSTPSSPTPRVIPKWLWSAVSYAWDHDITPGMLIRGFGPLAPMIARGSTKRRFSRLVLAKPVDPSLLYALGMYFYHNLGGDGSGEYVLRHVFAPGAKARDAMGERLLVAVNAGALTMPISFTYGGSHDWMSASAGRHYADLFVKAGLRSSVHLVTPGGHHMYLESSDQFNQIVLKELHQTFSIFPSRIPALAALDTADIAILTPKQAEVVGVGSPMVRPSSTSNKMLDAVATME